MSRCNVVVIENAELTPPFRKGVSDLPAPNGHWRNHWMEAAGTLRRQHCPCRGLRSSQMRRWQLPNVQQLLLHLLHLLLTERFRPLGLACCCLRDGCKPAPPYFRAGGSSQPSSRSPEPRPPFPRLSRLISTTSHGSWIATTSTVLWRCLPPVW